MPSGNGREKHHHRDGRREPGLGGGRRDMGRVGTNREALYTGEPSGGAQESLRRVCGKIYGAGEIAARWRWTRSSDGHGAVRQRAATEDGDELRRDWRSEERRVGKECR